MIIKREYEPEIDGLRAVAVLSVILFHAKIIGFSGGFVGVDIFFVISGYLITRNIVNDLQDGAFSFGKFYIKRARRIFPAMFFTMLLVAILGAWLFSPEHLERLGGALVYASAAIPNLYFWQEAGYWDTLNDFKPLLHFWSLGVEEQFYFIWPLLLFILFKPNTLKQALILSTTFLLFFGIASVISAQIYLEIDDSAVFYLMPFRIYEFGIGALLVWLPRLSQKFSLLKELIFLCGLIAITFSITTYSENTAFPGLTALIPCLGAGAIIYARTAKNLGLILNNKPMVGIGLISYSLYLIHWPVFVFYKYMRFSDISLYESLNLILFSITIAYFMYRFIEQPFRRAPIEKQNHLKPKAFAASIVVALILLTVPSAHAWKNEGWFWRVSPEIEKIVAFQSTAKHDRNALLYGCLRNIECNLDGRRFVKKRYYVLGDSFAEDYLIALRAAYPEYIFLKNPHGNCKPLLNYKTSGPDAKKRRECERVLKKLFSGEMDLHEYDGVVLGMIWYEENLGLLQKTVKHLKSQGVKKIVLVGPKLKLNVVTNQLLARSKSPEEFINLTRKNANYETKNRLSHLAVEMLPELDIHYIDIYKAQCPGGKCEYLVPGTTQTVIIDYGHFSIPGAAWIGKNIRELYPDLF